MRLVRLVVIMTKLYKKIKNLQSGFEKCPFLSFQVRQLFQGIPKTRQVTDILFRVVKLSRLITSSCFVPVTFKTRFLIIFLYENLSSISNKEKINIEISIFVNQHRNPPVSEESFTVETFH